MMQQCHGFTIDDQRCPREQEGRFCWEHEPPPSGLGRQVLGWVGKNAGSIISIIAAVVSNWPKIAPHLPHIFGNVKALLAAAEELQEEVESTEAESVGESRIGELKAKAEKLKEDYQQLIVANGLDKEVTADLEVAPTATKRFPLKRPVSPHGRALKKSLGLKKAQKKEPEIAEQH